MTDHKAPGGASSMSLPVAAFAYEVLHGTHLCEAHLEAAMESATARLRRNYPKLELAIAAARNALAELYQVAGEVWHAEAKRAEAGDASVGT